MKDMVYTILIEAIKNCGQIYIDCGNKTFGKALIDTSDVIEHLCEDNKKLTDTIEHINNSPKDHEGNYVITCKECRYKSDAKVNKKGFLICPASGMEIADDDFCSYAERMDEEEKPKEAECRNDIGSQQRIWFGGGGGCIKFNRFGIVKE